MRKSDIIVGKDYAYNRRRSRYGSWASRVRVINRSDIPEGERVHSADSNGNVLIVRLTEDGEVVTPSSNTVWFTPIYERVASRYIVSTWEVEVDRRADAKAASERRAKQQAIEKAAREALLAEFAEDIDAAVPVLDSLGLPKVTLDRTFGYRATVGTYDGSRDPQVLLSRKAFNALIAAVRDNVTEVAA